MPNRASLNLRARNVGIDPANYPNDSKLEQRVLYEEKQAGTASGTLATGTLTSDATNVSNNETFTIGGRTYTFKTTLTEVNATQTLTSDATNPSDGDTISIGDQTYTFKTTLTSPAVPNEIKIGADAATTLDYVKDAINGTSVTAGPGTGYSTGTKANQDVTAGTNTNTTQAFTAISYDNGNTIATTETSAHLSFGGATLSGGVPKVVASVAADNAALSGDARV